MKYILSLLVLFLLGCQNPTIYVVQEGYSDEKITKLVSNIASLGFDVKKSDISIPDNFYDSSIAMHPDFRDFVLLKELHDVLSTLGYSSAREYRFAQGQHFYNKSNLGLYLRNSSVASKPKIPPYLRTQFCKYAEGTLQFTNKGIYNLEYDNQADRDGDLLVSTGTWFFHANKLTLISKEYGEQVFTRYNENKETYLGMKPADVYKPKNNDHAFLPFNCSYLIIYMQ